MRTKDASAEVFIFARFRSREGQAEAVAAVMREMLVPVRAEAGCIAIDVFQSTREPRLFYVHSRWVDEAAFDVHASLPHTVSFIKRVQPLIDHPLEVTRTKPISR
jgi:quinol monooxygenase YgiN